MARPHRRGGAGRAGALARGGIPRGGRRAGAVRRARSRRRAGRDHPTLLVALLEELIYLADTDGFVADDAAVTLSETDLRVELTGRTTSVQPIVKAATYHDLQFQTTDGCWEARVILDV
jgi:SHS2 domain-containing protein